MRPQDQEFVVQEVTGRLLGRAREADRDGGPTVEALVHDTIYHERRRLDEERDPRERAEGLAWWKLVGRRMGRASEAEQFRIYEEVVERFAREVLGRFNPLVYEVACRAVPVGLGFLLNAVSPRLLGRGFPRLPDVGEAVVVQGRVDELRRLSRRGTVILAPTHVSNMDSPVIGWALHTLGLPPFLYGAGLNLFSNPLLSFFMHNLGAYKVDRRKTASLYKEVLKEYATVALELGYDNLFFPGGTRSRSGEVERHLKLGLMGCGLRAYVQNLREGRDRPEVYVVPATISYALVLEAETLIADHLKSTGRSRFIITDDEFSHPRRVLQFVGDLFRLDGRIYVTVADPVDCFGNRVDAERGVSLDDRGRAVDTRRYVLVGGKPDHDPQRDAEYTRELGLAVVRQFARHNVGLATHLLAYSAWRMLRARRPGVDLYRFLRTTVAEDSLPMGELARDLERLLAEVRGLEDRGEIRLDPRLPRGDPQAVADEGLRGFGTYHTRAALYRRGDRVHPAHMELVLYYRNRLAGYGLEGDRT
ncbi:MAG: 1-acyl-sn-glycerol-3-phosphate acyltransferase [Planctomycetes bacterium]|nr:1-acyl-sn-glycerol-3-phosphate acyltransferase [Planctomycetota bacterium]